MKRSIVLAVVAAAFGLTACTSGGTTEAQPPASTTSTPTSQTSTASPPTSVVTEQVTETVTKPVQPPAKPVLDASGYGALKMGMTLQQAMATGMLGPSEGPNPDQGACTLHALKGTDQKVYVSKQLGVSTINFTKAMSATGVGIGSTTAEVAKAYPALKKDEVLKRFYGPAGGKPDAKYVFIYGDGKVAFAQLNLNRQDCHS